MMKTALIQKYQEIDLLLKQIPYVGQYAWYIILALAVLLIGLLVRSMVKRKKPVPRAPLEKTPAAKEGVEAEVAVEPEEYEAIGRESIVKFFLRLYKVQLGEPQTVKSEFRPLDSESSAAGTTYELRVQCKKDWESRRMTVGLAGEEGTSRSKCYHVIYDDHLIVKIPRTPVTDFEVYLSAIESDQKIVKKLAPRECIVPTVSAVLKIIYPVAKTQSATAIEIEEKYLERLRKVPQFQEYLKIGHAFVFVMDLSRYFFLSQIIYDFHDLKNKMYQEVVGYPDVIWENHGFEGRYAFENDDQVEAVRNVYADFETKLLGVIKKAGLEKPPARFVMQKWFLLHLAGREIEANDKDLNPALVLKINMLARKHFSENRRTIENYLTTIKSCIQTVTISQNKKEICGLVTNLLDLVVWLREKGVAMRDLKPDNLLVAGNQKNYPGFLSSADNYTVGLIDVETAVTYKRGDDSELSQPILGGTPSFATPAHLVSNGSLQQFFGEPTRILYLQDWYAIVGIIFEVITGETLFVQTGKMIVGIKTVMNKHMENIEAQFEMFKKTSRMFWYAAKTELKMKSREKKEILEMVKVAIPGPVRDMFRQELLKQKADIAGRIKRTAKNQNIFKDEKNIKGLIAAPRQKVTQLKKKWKQQYKENKAGIQLLDELEQLKLEDEKLQQLFALFDKSALVLPAYELINFIFELVIQAMYHKEWGELLAAEVVGVAEGSETTTVESTV